MWDLTEARVLIDARDYRVTEFAVSGSFLKQAYSLSYKLITPQRRRRRVAPIPSSFRRSPGRSCIAGEGSSVPSHDVVVLSLRELTQAEAGPVMAARRAIRVDGLTKYYGAVVGIEELSFEVARGEVYGFLGANGAGQDDDDPAAARSAASVRGRATVLGVDCHRDEPRGAPADRLPAWRPADLSGPDRRATTSPTCRGSTAVRWRRPTSSTCWRAST